MSMKGHIRTGFALSLAGPGLLCASLVVAADDARSLRERIDAAVERHADAAIELRHRIHRNPELGNREFETAALIAAHLRDLGLEVWTEVAHTGVVGILRGGKPGPVVAVRADIDALPVVEETDLPFRSTVRTSYLGKDVGVMHACGHDIHTAVQLGVAAVLADMRDEIPGTVKFIFQPAEEGPPPGEEGGARLMIEQGVLRDPVPGAIFGLHSAPEFTVGQVGYTIGPAMASVDHFSIDVIGVQSHGARPEDSVDPIVIAAQLVMALQTIKSRNLPPDVSSVITVGIIDGGQRYNIIPGSVHLEGTVRSYDGAVQDTIERRMHEITSGITQAGGASFEFEYGRVTPAMINDPTLTVRMLDALVGVLGTSNVIEISPLMIGEDFAEFSNRVPGFYYRLGTTRPGTTSTGTHTPTFTGDDAAVTVGMRVMSNLVIDWLASEP
jgi:amidohydrolase